MHPRTIGLNAGRGYRIRLLESLIGRHDERHIPRDVPEALPVASQLWSELVAGVPHLAVIPGEGPDGVIEQVPRLGAGAAGATADLQRAAALPADPRPVLPLDGDRPDVPLGGGSEVGHAERV